MRFFKKFLMLRIFALVTQDLNSVDLGTAGNYAILAKTGISTVPDSVITGDIAVSPIAQGAITGFNLNAPTIFSEDQDEPPQLTGKAFAADYAEPTPTILTTAILDMERAFEDAKSRPNTRNMRINLRGGLLGGLTLTRGVYTFGSDVSITSDVTLVGSEADIFIIQISGKVTQSSDTKVILSGGALPKNIFWQVAGNMEVGAGALMQGVLLVKTDVTFITGSTLNGRVLTQTACNLQMATITRPM